MIAFPKSFPKGLLAVGVLSVITTLLLYFNDRVEFVVGGAMVNLGTDFRIISTGSTSHITRKSNPRRCGAK